MAHRRRDDDWIVPITGLVGLAMLAFIFIPGFRQLISLIGFVALILLGLVIFSLVLFGIYRLATPERNMRAMTGNVFAPPSRFPDQKSDNYQLEPKYDDYEPVPEQPPKPEPPINLVERLRSMDWFQFEKLVGHVYENLGYSVTRRGGANPDGGIDLVIEKDEQRIAVQCKQWKTWNVGVKPIREFLGALTDAGIQKGIFITLRGYTGEASQLAEKHGIEIVNEVGLTQTLESTDARFDPAVLELLRDARKFCPRCECEMVIRVAGKGPNRGGKFWGCSGFPKCYFRLPIT